LTGDVPNLHGRGKAEGPFGVLELMNLLLLIAFAVVTTLPCVGASIVDARGRAAGATSPAS
jgi:hypothetical protein